MRIYLTGATGVIGRRITPLLIAAGHEVTAAVRHPSRAAELEHMGARAVTVDLFDRHTLARSVAGHEVLINMATHIPRSTARMFLPGAWRENDRIRAIASANLVDAALATGVERFIQESLALVYPDRGADWIDEDTALEPVRYNRSVKHAEASALRFAAAGGHGIVLRFAAFYGPDASQSREMIGVVRRGRAPLPGDSAAYFSSVSHDDAATAVIASLDVPAGTYNVVDDEPLPRRDFAASLAAALGVPTPRPLPTSLTKLAGSLGTLMSRSLRISNRKLRDTSGWHPRSPSVREGWRAVVAALEGA